MIRLVEETLVFLFKQMFEMRQEGNIIPRGNEVKIQPFLSQTIILAVNFIMHMHYGFFEVLSTLVLLDVLREINGLESNMGGQLQGHLFQSILRPVPEPINHTAVVERRRGGAPVSEIAACRVHSEHHM